MRDKSFSTSALHSIFSKSKKRPDHAEPVQHGLVVDHALLVGLLGDLREVHGRYHVPELQRLCFFLTPT